MKSFLVANQISIKSPSASKKRILHQDWRHCHIYISPNTDRMLQLDSKISNSFVVVSKLCKINHFICPIKKIIKEASRTRSGRRCLVCGNIIRTDLIRKHIQKFHSDFLDCKKDCNDYSNEVKLERLSSSQVSNQKLQIRGKTKGPRNYFPKSGLKEKLEAIKKQVANDELFTVSGVIKHLDTEDNKEKYANVSKEIEKYATSFEFLSKRRKTIVLLQCYYCGITIPTIEELNNHLQLKHNTKLIKHISEKEKHFLTKSS